MNYVNCSITSTSHTYFQFSDVDFMHWTRHRHRYEYEISLWDFYLLSRIMY